KHVGKNLAISLQEFITLSFLYRKRTIKRILFAFIFQTSALPVQSRLVRNPKPIRRFRLIGGLCYYQQNKNKLRKNPQANNRRNLWQTNELKLVFY
ncbi:MAG TPA: hypothetical protein VNI84_09290, partial [Pyrinomonadaceae bacterium]|nr:hypothetical protein [Pyrinomonadaceae bacterium]